MLRVLLLALGMLALLSLVAAVSRAHHVPGSRSDSHSLPHGVADYLFTIFVLVVVGDFCFVVWLWFQNRDVLMQQRRQRRGRIRALVALMVFALIAASIARTHPFGIGAGSASRSGLDVARSTKELVSGAKRRGTPRTPEFQWLPVAVAAAAGLAVLGVIGVRAARRERRGLDEAYLLQLEFESLVEGTLADLYAEQDPRKAIIAAYARVERLFATYGLGRDPAEAPVEYLDRVLPELRASGAALGRLTRLFEWAKFSAHDVEPGMRDDAIQALVEVRDELRANRLEEELRKASQPVRVRS